MLENLNVIHAAKCRIYNLGSNESGVYTVVSCTSNDKSLVRHFITLISSLVLSLPERPSCQSAAAAIQKMIRLFRALQRPSTRTIQGLWAELFVIRAAPNAKAMVQAWRADPLEQFDFAELDERLEVKSTRLTKRSHQFSLVQVRAPMGVNAIVASVQVASMTNGLKLSDLWHNVRSLVEDDHNLLIRVDRVVTTSLGRAWRRGINASFDEAVARATLAFFDAKKIPSVEPSLPAEVSDVHFRSDLSAIAPLGPADIPPASPFFKAAMSFPK